MVIYVLGNRKRSVQNSLLSVAAALSSSVCFAFEKVMKTASYNRFGHLMALLEFRMKDGIIGLLMFLIQEFIIKHPKNSAMTRWLTGEALSRPKLDRASNGCQVKDGESQKGGCRSVRSI